MASRRRTHQPAERHTDHYQRENTFTRFHIEAVRSEGPELGRNQNPEYSNPNIIGKANSQVGLAQEEESALHRQQNPTNPGTQLPLWQSMIQRTVSWNDEQQYQRDHCIGVALGFCGSLTKQQGFAQCFQHVVRKHYQEAIHHKIQYGQALSGTQQSKGAQRALPASMRQCFSRHEGPAIAAA